MKLSKELAIKMLRQMILIRRIEERYFDLYSRGEGVGLSAQCNGQEAVPVGICNALQGDDYISPTHRVRGHVIAKGIDLKAMMAELFGKRTGICKGKGGPLHMVDISTGILPVAAIVGAGIPISVGVGLSIKKRGTNQLVACFFGDGACNIAFFHEGLNFAAIHKLPVLFVCENNQYAISMPQKKSMLVKIVDRAASYGMPGIAVDGNDVAAVYHAAKQAAGRAREGSGPTLIECITYRFMGHYQGDAFRGIKYRTQEEMDEWAKRCPIELLKKKLLDERTVDEAVLDAMESEITAEIEEAVEYAKTSPFPEPKEALDDVFAA
jgi:acetoin:2,6-dichlorophenolindophenol oxidoreductase subunit alpha